MNQKGFQLITAVVVSAIVAGLVGGFWLFEKKEKGVLNAGIVNIETAKVGEHYGIWTVKETNIKREQGQNPADGSTFTGLKGQIFFDGSLEISGAYHIDELSGGLSFLPDREYYDALPTAKYNSYDRNESVVGKYIVLDNADVNFFGDKGRLTIVINNLRYQTIFCWACDAYQGFLANISEIKSVDADSTLQTKESRVLEANELFFLNNSVWKLYSDAMPLGFIFRYPQNYSTFPITPLDFFADLGQASVVFGDSKDVLITLEIKDLNGMSYDVYKRQALDSCKSLGVQEECFNIVEYETFKGYTGLAYSLRDPEIEGLGYRNVIVFVHNGKSFLFSRIVKYGELVSDPHVLLDMAGTIDFFEP